jgi:hypothetical protein
MSCVVETGDGPHWSSRGGEWRMREVVAELQASLEANHVSSRWWQGVGFVGGDSHGREWGQSLGPHGRRVAHAGGGGWVTGLVGGKLGG